MLDRMRGCGWAIVKSLWARQTILQRGSGMAWAEATN